MSDSPSAAELLVRLERLESVVAQRDALIVERDQRIAVLTARVQQLEALLRKDSTTSSKPPSSDGPLKPAPRSRRESSGRLAGKQPGEPGLTLRHVETPDEVVTHRPSDCGGCRRRLHRASVASGRDPAGVRPARGVCGWWSIGWSTVVAGAGTSPMARVPAGGALVQYGPRVRAVGAYLVGYQHLPYERACEALADLLGVGMSVGTLVTVVQRTSAWPCGSSGTARTAAVSHGAAAGQPPTGPRARSPR